VIDGLNFSYLFGLLEKEIGITVPEKIKTFVSTLYFGDERGKVGYTPSQSRADMITILISIVLEIVEAGDNAEAIDAYLKEKGIVKDDKLNPVSGIVKLLTDENGEIEVQNINWEYILEKEEDETTDKYPRTETYLSYESDWTKSTATYAADNLDAIVADALELSKKDAKSIEDLIGKKIFSADILNTIEETVNGLLKKLDDLGKNTKDDHQSGSVKKVLEKLLDSNLDFDIKYVSKEEEVTGDKTKLISGREDFEEALTGMLCKLNRVWKFLLLGEDIALFSASGMVDGVDGIPA